MTKNIKIGLMMFAAMMVAVMFTGCSSDDFVEEIELEEMPIEFSSTTQNTTRAAIADNAGLAAAGGFSVWGWKTKTEGLDWVNNPCYTIFDKVNVYSSGNNGAYNSDKYATNWTYETKKYWDRQSTYCFYAAAPKSDKISLIGTYNNAKHFEIAGATSMSSDATGCNDFIITRENVQREGTNNTNVDFTFHHVMSKVALKFKAGIDNCTITVTDVKLTGWSNASYNFTQDLSYTAGASMSEWKLPENTKSNVAGEATFLEEGNLPFGNNVDGVATEATIPTYWIMVPQAVENLTFTVNYTITYNDGVVDSFEGVTGTLTDQYWYTDCCTTYTLTISPNPIKFNVSKVEWSGNSDATIIVQ